MLYLKNLRRRRKSSNKRPGEEDAPGRSVGASIAQRPNHPKDTMKELTLYIAGPMRGYDDFNFPAFFKAEAAIEKMGHRAINPARHDNDAGFDETAGEVTQQYLRDALAWDLGQVCRSDGIVILDGWYRSRGARAEVAAARAVDIPIYIICTRNGDELYLREAHHVGS